MSERTCHSFFWKKSSAVIVFLPTGIPASRALFEDPGVAEAVLRRDLPAEDLGEALREVGCGRVEVEEEPLLLVGDLELRREEAHRGPVPEDRVEARGLERLGRRGVAVGDEERAFSRRRR